MSTLLSTQPTRDAEMSEDGSASEDERPSLFPPEEDDGDAVMIEPTSLLSSKSKGKARATEDQSAGDGLDFPELKNHGTPSEKALRKVSIPPHRMTPLKRDWVKIYAPLVDECGLQVRMNVKRRAVEMKVRTANVHRQRAQTSKHTPAPGTQLLQKAADFLGAYCLGFAVEDAIALVRMDDLYVESFEVKDVKSLSGDHLSRAIGRIAGKDGRTRFTIENASRTRIVLADTKIHILGTFSSIKIARDAVCALILGSPPGKVYGNLRNVAARQKQRF